MSNNLLLIVAAKIRKRAEWDIQHSEKEAERQRERAALGRLCLDIAKRVKDGGLTQDQCDAALELAMPTPVFTLGEKREAEGEARARLARVFGIAQ